MYALFLYGSCRQLVTNLLDVKSSPFLNKNTKTPAGIVIDQ